MKFPHSHKKLVDIFKKSGVPKIDEFYGEYSVDMLSGLPSLKIFGHRKIFEAQNGKKVLGHNIIFKNRAWGRFFLEEGFCPAIDSSAVVEINYNCPQNSFFTKPILDQLRVIEKGKIYLGRFNYFLFGKLHFLGYFSLEKIKTEGL